MKLYVLINNYSWLRNKSVPLQTTYMKGQHSTRQLYMFARQVSNICVYCCNKKYVSPRPSRSSFTYSKANPARSFSKTAALQMEQKTERKRVRGPIRCVCVYVSTCCLN